MYVICVCIHGILREILTLKKLLKVSRKYICNIQCNGLRFFVNSPIFTAYLEIM
jgi:hypothetical protein